MKVRIGSVLAVAAVAIFGSWLAFGAVRGSAAASTGPSAAELAAGHWTVLAQSPLGERVNGTAVWTGRQLIEAGGETPGRFGDGVGGRLGTSTAAFDPQTRRWRMLAGLPDRSLAVNAVSVRTGSRLFLLAQPRRRVATSPALAAVYNPAANSWSSAPPAPIAAPSLGAAAVWSSGRVVVATISGNFIHGTTLATAAYGGADGKWSSIPLTLPRGHDAAAVAMTATRDGVVLWSSWSRTREYGPGSFAVYSGIDVFRLVGNRWIQQRVDWPQHQTADQPLFTGSRILLGASQIWCGICSHPAPVDANGRTADPATLLVSKLPHGPLDDVQPQILWSGTVEIALNTGGEILGPHLQVRPGDIAFLDLDAMRWHRGPRAPLNIESGMPAVWDGSNLLALATDGQLLSYRP